MRNIKMRKNNPSFNNNKINSLNSLDLTDIYFIQNKENIKFYNNTNISQLEYNKKINKNKLKIEVPKNINDNINKKKASKIGPTKSFNEYQFIHIKNIFNDKQNKNNIISSKKETNDKNLLSLKNKFDKENCLYIPRNYNINNLKRNKLNKEKKLLTKNQNEIISNTTYNIYNLNTPIYNLINIPPIITSHKKYFSPINNSSNISRIFKNKNNSSLFDSISKKEKNKKIFKDIKKDKKIIKQINKNNKAIHQVKKEQFSLKRNLHLNTLIHQQEINNFFKKKNLKTKLNNYNRNNLNLNKKNNIKKYLSFLSLGKKDSKINSKENSISFLNQLNSSFNSNDLKTDILIEKKPKIIKKVMKINSCTLAGYSAPGVKKINQDKFFIKKDFLGEKEQFFIGVCDGHGMHGHYISEYISKFLPQNITNISNESIKSAFIQTQNSLLSENTKIDSSLSGTTCTSVIISQDKIIIANLGDSRAIISLYESGIYNTINLSHDHNLKEPKEMKRILNNGGVIRQYTDEKGGYIGPERVFLKNSEIPGLAMSRTFGDSIAHGIGVISEPEIFEYNYKGSEKFIVIATDGIWEFIDSDECSKIVGEFYENNMDAVGGLNALVKEAFKRWKYQENNVDDITAILIFFE